MSKGARGFIAIACLLLAAPAVAGNVYRCTDGGGARSFSSSPVPGARCSLVDQAPASAATPSSSAAPAAAGASSRRVSGKVYSYVKDGVRHLTSTPPSGSVGALKTVRYSYLDTCYACGRRPGVDFASVRLNTSAYDEEISAASKRYGVDEAVVRAVIHAESAFDPRALSRVGAQGLMQLMPDTARRFGVGDAFDAGQNIRGGVQYLAWLLKRFDGNLKLAAAGYNAGEGAVARYKGVPPYAETRRYVERVALLADRYRRTVAAR